jgi:holdfast attachment protein HfaA
METAVGDQGIARIAMVSRVLTLAHGLQRAIPTTHNGEVFGMKNVLAKVLLIGVTGVALVAAANAQPSAPYGAEFERPIGWAYGSETQPIEGGTRDINGNRVIIDGRIVTGDNLTTLPGGLYNMNGLTSGGSGYSGVGGFAGSSGAIGNQLNVITQGSFNTVVVNSTQINNGNQTAVVNNGHQPSVLNGELNLND